MSVEVWERTTPRELTAVIDEVVNIREAERRQANHRAGTVAATVAKAWLEKRGGSKDFRPEDFFPVPREPMTLDEMEAVMDRAMGLTNRMAEA